MVASLPMTNDTGTDELVIAAIARMTRQAPAAILGHLSLGSVGLSRSFGLGALRSHLEARLGRRIGTLSATMSVAELQRLLAAAGESATRAAATPEPLTATRPTTPPTPEPIGLGMDIQELATMPITHDYRGHEFYVAHFDPTEIATALLRHDPRSHLCGVFCAKEAAKKSHPDLLPLRMREFVVSHDGAGRPQLQLAAASVFPERFRFLLSISHTAQFSAATCLTLW